MSNYLNCRASCTISLQIIFLIVCLIHLVNLPQLLHLFQLFITKVMLYVKERRSVERKRVCRDFLLKSIWSRNKLCVFAFSGSRHSNDLTSFRCIWSIFKSSQWIWSNGYKMSISPLILAFLSIQKKFVLPFLHFCLIFPDAEPQRSIGIRWSNKINWNPFSRTIDARAMAIVALVYSVKLTNCVNSAFNTFNVSIRNHLPAYHPYHPAIISYQPSTICN